MIIKAQTAMTTNKKNIREEAKKYAVFALMTVICLGCLWLIFAPSEAAQEQAAKQEGFNSTIPDPEGAGIVGDKKAAYEQDERRREQEAKMRSLEEFAFALGEGAESTSEPSAEPASNTATERYDANIGGNTSRKQVRREDSFEASDAAYREIGRTLGNFYTSPKEDTEKEELRKRVEELEARKTTKTPATSSATPIEEQIALLEKSYELAAKYAGGKAPERDTSAKPEHEAQAEAMGQVVTELVTTLPQAETDGRQVTGELQTAFQTPVGEMTATAKNTIRACVHADQTLVDGQGVRLRLLERMRVGSTILPRNTLLTGTASLHGERLAIVITSVEFAGQIIPVKLTVYDSDGQEGIYIPNSMEIDAAKEVATNLGQNMGTSVSITNQSAGGQLLTEAGKGAIQGVSQYISRKARQVKVHLKAGYRVMLYEKER